MRIRLVSKNVIGGAILLLLVPGFAAAKAQESPVNAPNILRLSLRQAIEVALSENPTIKVADQEIELKKEANREACAGLLPEASLSGAYSRTLKKQTVVMDFGGQSQTFQMGTENSYNGGLAVNLPLYAPALYRTIHLTRTDVDLALEKARSSRLGMINQVAKAYYQLLLAQDSYEVLQKSFAQAEANFRIVSEKYKQGLVSEYDRIRADVQVRSLKPSVVSARNGMNLSKLQLKVLMGLSVETEIEAAGNLKDYETAIAGTPNLKPLSLDANSDLKQLDLNAQMLTQTLQIQKADFIPTVGVAFNYAYTSLNDHFKFGDYKWFPYSTLALSVSIPLYKASNFPKIRQTRIKIRQLEETRLNTERMLYMQINSYLDNMDASTEQLASNKESIFQAERGRLIAQKRYEVGKGTILELNDSEVALMQAQLTYNQSVFNYLTAKADLEQALGNDKITE